MTQLNAIVEAFKSNYRQSRYIAMPQAPRTNSSVPWLTSLYHNQEAGNYGNRNYPGNCSGNLIFFFQQTSVFDPMSGGGISKDVCDSLGIPCVAGDLKTEQDATDAKKLPKKSSFDMVWMHPPYWRMIRYSDNARDLSTTETLADFNVRLRQSISNALNVLNPGGEFIILIGDYSGRGRGFVPLVFETKRISFDLGLVQSHTDIIRFSHGASSGSRRYRSNFIPGLHDACMIFERKQDIDPATGEVRPY